jgi:hypothetical protein
MPKRTFLQETHLHQALRMRGFRCEASPSTDVSNFNRVSIIAFQWYDRRLDQFRCVYYGERLRVRPPHETPHKPMGKTAPIL